MTLSEMRRALRTGGEENFSGAEAGGTEDAAAVAAATTTTTTPEEEAQIRKLQARLAPDSRGVKESRSSLIEVDLSAPDTPAQKPRRGTLTFANSVRELKRAGSSRGAEEVFQGGSAGAGAGGDGSSPSNSANKGLQRAPPRRAQSCKQG